MASITKRSRAEMDKLWHEYGRTKSQEIRNTLAEEYLPIVRFVADRMMERLPHNVQVEDLCSAGVFGLLDAIDKFDITRGFRFETYCTNRIRGAILDELRSMDWVPRLTRARANGLERAYQKLEREHGRAPTDLEMARELRVSIDRLDELYRETSGAVVTGALTRRTLSKDPELAGVDVMEDGRGDGPFSSAEKSDFVDYCKKNLSTKERYILMLYYYDELTLKEIGSILGLSESRVCQLHAKLVTRLRAFMQRRKGA
jgi:RNA polymerase sigma factor for flagellar operon FliA